MTIFSFKDNDSLIKIISDQYHINATDIKLHRDCIGRVYLISADEKRYVLKIYRSFNKEKALQSVEILGYLNEKGYPAVRSYFKNEKSAICAVNQMRKLRFF